MDESICKFIPVKDYAGSIKTVHFVYESEFHKLKQPFLHTIYYAYLVTGGSATLKCANRTSTLKKGTLFFTFPAVPAFIDGSEDFKYLYISFMGPCVPSLLQLLDISHENAVFEHFDHMIDFWISSIARVNHQNANLLSEGILLCTLSFINSKDALTSPMQSNEDLFAMILDYIDNHYRDTDISLKKLAALFSYNEKYLSHLFKRRMNLGFSQYINRLRIQYAHDLIDRNITSVSQIAALCGFSDAFYFSRVFKKICDISPTEYINSR